MGCGAMGSIYAGLLASNGNEVVVVDEYEDHINAINNNGLRVSGASGDRTVTVQGFTEVPYKQVELIVIAVKSADAGSAVAAASPMIDGGTIVLTIQNGLGSADLVADNFNGDRLIVGVAKGFGASLKGPGHSHHNDMKAIRMGAYAGLSFETVSQIAALWKDAGFDAEAIEDITAMQWEKLICNVAYSAIAALSGLTVGQILADPELGRVSRDAATEAWNVARARGVAINVEDPVAHITEFASRMPDAKPSVLLDIEAGRKSEIDMINGAIISEAEKAGMSAPVNATLTGLVRALERRKTIVH
jgi:2-dehydropantoate 2-reductase